MSALYKKVELLANIAIIVVALLIVGLFAQRYFGNRAAPPLQIAAGTKISLPETDWAKNKQTMLVVLQKDCHFCSESAQFYQRLVKETAGRGDIRLVAVLPQQMSEGKQYLNDLDVPIEEVKQASLSSVGVRGTPTLILVDSKGAVVDSWVGKLPANKETEVLNRLKSNTVASRNN
ncbi:MAG: peroxiredoxin family protein [Pyrinomonadaceae bacterium]